MPTEAFNHIESEFARLSPAAQPSLLERLLHRVRLSVSGDEANWDADLSAMAADPAIQGELKRIDGEFRLTEADGLGQE